MGIYTGIFFFADPDRAGNGSVGRSATLVQAADS